MALDRAESQQKYTTFITSYCALCCLTCPLSLFCVSCPRMLDFGQFDFGQFELSCETPAAPPDRAAGARTRQPENSKCVHFRAPALQTPPKFHERTPRERKKIEYCGGRREKKARNFGLPTLQLHPSGLHPSGSTLRGPTFSGFGPPPFGSPTLCGPKIQHLKIGRSRNWPKSILAEVDIGRSRYWPNSKKKTGDPRLYVCQAPGALICVSPCGSILGPFCGPFCCPFSGPFGVCCVHVVSVLCPFLVHLGSNFWSILCPFGVHFAYCLNVDAS